MRQDVADFYSGISFDAYLLLGAHPSARGGWLFTVWAPHARRVQVVGDWNGWDLYHTTELAACEDGLWRGHAPDAQAGQLYKLNLLCADGEWRLRTDPFAFAYEPLPGTAARLCVPEFVFSDGAWCSHRSAGFDAPVNIYELYAGSWRRHADGRYYSFSELGEALIPYLHQHHYTHVEFMPLAEYPFDGSWGYQGCGYFAPSARFGGIAAFAALVNALHRAGIGVLMDFVPVHFAPDDGRLARFDGEPLYEYAGDAGYSSWGSCNFDLSSGPVRSFLLSAAAFWLHVCHCDGLRVDAVGNALYRDSGSWQTAEFFKTLTAGLHARCPGSLLVAEDTAGALSATAPTEYGGLGFDYIWDLGWATDALTCFSSPPDARSVAFARLVGNTRGRPCVINAISHDDNAWGTGTVFYRLYGEEEDRLAQARLLYLYQMCRPGKKLGFMGGEFGNFLAFDPYCELDWGMLINAPHRALSDYCASLNEFYLTHPALYRAEWRDTACHILCADAGAGLLAFLRCADGENLLCVFNMGGGAVTDYGLDLRFWGWDFTALPLFAAGAVDSATLHSAGGWLSVCLPPYGGAVFALC